MYGLKRGLTPIKKEYKTWTKLLYIQKNNAMLRRVVNAAEAFRNTVNRQGGMKNLPTKEANATTKAYLELEKALDNLQ